MSVEGDVVKRMHKTSMLKLQFVMFIRLQSGFCELNNIMDLICFSNSSRNIFHAVHLLTCATANIQ